MTRRRAARQPERRDAVLSIRMSHEQRAEIAQRAHGAGMTDSGYAATVLLKRKPTIIVPEYRQIDPSLFNELRRIGNNLNQIAHQAHLMQLHLLQTETRATLVAVNAAIERR